jgi:hypothetical protein
MADEPATTPRRSKPKGGRPSRAQASAKALAGVDLANVDPVAVLRSIAGDTSAPASARVSAARTLLGLAPGGEAGDGVGDDLSRRAVELLAQQRGLAN